MEEGGFLPPTPGLYIQMYVIPTCVRIEEHVLRSNRIANVLSYFSATRLSFYVKCYSMPIKPGSTFFGQQEGNYIVIPSKVYRFTMIVTTFVIVVPPYRIHFSSRTLSIRKD